MVKTSLSIFGLALAGTALLASIIAGVARLIPSAAALLAIAIISTVALAALFIDRKRTGGDGFSVLGLTTVYFVLNGAAGFLFFVNRDEQLNRYGYRLSDLYQAAILYALGFSAIALGYSLFKFVSLRRLSVGLFSGRTLSETRICGLLILGWVSRAILLASGRYSHIASDVADLQSDRTTFLLNTASTLPLLAYFLIASNRVRGSTLRSAILVALFASELAWAIPTGARGSVVAILLGTLITQYYRRGMRLSLPTVTVFVLAALVAFPLLSEQRNESLGTSADKQVLETAQEGLVSAIPQTVLGRFSDSEAIAAALYRRDSLDGLLTPSRFAGLVGAQAVPRAIWPAKPDANRFGNEYGRATGIISPDDEITSINTPIPLMWWLIGGYPLVIVGGVLVGLFLKSVNELTIARLSGGPWLAIYATLAFNITTLSASIVPAGIAGLIKLGPVLVLVTYLVTTKDARKLRHVSTTPTYVDAGLK